jgi:hypothetical protein
MCNVLVRLLDFRRASNSKSFGRSLEQNSPDPRTDLPPEQGEVTAIPHVGGLHHRYARAA